MQHYLFIRVYWFLSILGQPAIVTLGEYEYPLNYCVLVNVETKESQKIAAFIDSILVSTFSKNTSVSNGIIAGITSPTLCSPVGPIFESIHLYQSNLLEYFGFSDSNVIEIGKALGIGEMIPEARKWFNGNFSIYF